MTANDKTGKPTDRGKTIMSQLTKSDWILIVVGTLAALVHGAGFPLLSVVLGSMTTNFLKAQASSWVTGEPPKNGTEDISKQDFKHAVYNLCLYYFLLGIAQLVTSYIQIAAYETFCERFVHRMRLKYLWAILRQDISWFDEKQSGNLTSRLTDDLERVREGFGDKLSLLVQNLFAFLSSFVVGFIYSWKMTLVMIGFVPPIVLVGAILGKMTATRTQQEQEKYAVAGAIAEETFSSIRTVQSLNGQKRELARFEEALENARRTGLFKYYLIGFGIMIMHFCRYGSYALAFWYGSKLIEWYPTMNRGDVFTVFFAVMSGSTALSTALPYISNIAVGVGAARTVDETIHRIPIIDPYSEEGVKKKDLQGEIELKDVHFLYPSRPDIKILKGVSLRVKAGEKIALVGASGCGKSTIVNMLLRFYDPTSGNVSIDGIDLVDMNVKTLRNQIGVVSQEPILFDGSLLENIRMGKEDATDEDVRKACRMANALDFIEKLPQGLDTRVGERGVQMSGGQKQRVAIARALVKNPQILLLDEATSALDTESEAVVQRALDQAQQGRTVIIVAHRLATIRHVDQIFVFKEGNIIERGTHSELMEMHGAFHKMTEAQLLRQQESGQKDIQETPLSKNTRRFSRSTSVQQSVRSRGPSFIVSRRETTMSVLSDTTIEELTRIQEEVDKQDLKSADLSRILTMNKPIIPHFIVGVMCAAVIGLCTPMFAIVYTQIFSVFSEPAAEMSKSVRTWAFVFVGVGLVHGISQYATIIFCGIAGEGCTKGLRFAAFKNIVRQDIGFFDDLKHGTGKLCTRLATDAPNVRYVFTRFPLITSSFVTVVASLVIGFVFGWQLSLCLLPILPLIIAGGYFEMRIQMGNRLRDTKLLEEAGKVAAQAVEHVRTVQALNKQQMFNEMYTGFLHTPHRENIRGAHTYGIVFALSQAIIFLMYAFAFYLGSLFVLHGEMEPVGVYRVFFALAFCGQMVGSLSSFIPDIVKTKLAAALIFYLIDHPTKIDGLSEDGLVKKLDGEISLRNLHFNYPTRLHTKVLKGLSLDIHKGQTVAFVGHSGCGKSTVMGLLERFYNPLKGTITIDGTEIRNLSLASLRQQLCIVSQEPTLFDCSIKDNIVYGMNSDVNQADITEAAKLANIHTFIQSLPQGYDTPVGEKGTQLSGGQKQRIAIARALVRNPSILLLDEATSALDTESEKIVQEALERARKGRTCLVIAHRLSTIQDADLIAVVQEGRVAETGTHDSLLRFSELYRKLCETQKLVEAQ